MKIMKKLLVLVILFCTVSSFAQRERSPEARKAMMERLTKQTTPEDRAEIDAKQMTLRLDLTSSQEKQVKDALIAHYSEGKAKRQSIKKSDKKISDEERQKMRVERLDSQIALKAKMKTILNAQQYAKYSQMMERKKGKGKRRGKRK